MDEVGSRGAGSPGARATSLRGLPLPPDQGAPGLARRAVRGLPSRIQHLTPTLELLVSELVTNSVLHAGLLPTERIVMRVKDLGTHLRVEVADPGRGYEEARAGWARARAGKDGHVGEHGYGLGLVLGAADRAGVRWDEGTVAWFELGIDPVEDA